MGIWGTREGRRQLSWNCVQEDKDDDDGLVRHIVSWQHLAGWLSVGQGRYHQKQLCAFQSGPMVEISFDWPGV